jgi:hypothetical protein
LLSRPSVAPANGTPHGVVGRMGHESLVVTKFAPGMIGHTEKTIPDLVCSVHCLSFEGTIHKLGSALSETRVVAASGRPPPPADHLPFRGRDAVIVTSGNAGSALIRGLAWRRRTEP